jgi:hypothetical protein
MNSCMMHDWVRASFIESLSCTPTKPVGFWAKLKNRLFGSPKKPQVQPGPILDDDCKLVLIRRILSSDQVSLDDNDVIQQAGLKREYHTSKYFNDPQVHLTSLDKNPIKFENAQDGAGIAVVSRGRVFMSAQVTRGDILTVMVPLVVQF